MWAYGFTESVCAVRVWSFESFGRKLRFTLGAFRRAFWGGLWDVLGWPGLFAGFSVSLGFFEGFEKCGLGFVGTLWSFSLSFGLRV